MAEADGIIDHPDDLRLIRALQLAPRAPFTRIADALGLHERTVARRYRALRRAGVMRIFGVVNPMIAGHEIWNVRLRCKPEGSESLAMALAAREDVSWVGIVAAGSEVFFSIRSISTESRDVLLTRSLPKSPHVLGLEAAVVLHVALGMSADDWSGLGDRLTSAEIARLTDSAPATPQPDPGSVEWEPHDPAMIRELAADGRAGASRLAAAAGISEGRATRRLAALLEQRVLSIDVDLAAKAFGYQTSGRLHARVAPSHLDQAAQAVAELPEVGFVAATSGRDNLMAGITCRRIPDLYAFITTKIGALEGITSLEVVPVARVIKEAGGLVADGRLVDRLP